MLSPIPLPLSILRNGHHHNQKGFILKLLPEAKKINRQATNAGPDMDEEFYSITPTEELFYELRESFSIDFNFSHLDNIEYFYHITMIFSCGTFSISTSLS